MSRRRPAVAVAALLALAAGLGWWFWPQALRSAVMVLAPTPTDVSAGAGATPAPAHPPAAQAAAPAPSASRPVADDSVDLCGIGRVPLPQRTDGASRALNGALPGPLGAQARAAAWPRVLARLQAGSTPQEQAAALMLRIDGFVDAEAPEVPAAGPQEDRAALTAHLVRMARSAQGAAQADIVRWAVQACRRHPQAEGCSSLSPRDVLALDPTDGTAWLAEAAVRPAERDALLRAAAAPGLRFRDWSDALPAVALAAMPDDLPAYLLSDLSVLIVGIEAARPDPTGARLLAHCKREALADAARRTDCDALAQAMTTRSTSLTGLSVGRALAERLDWPQDQLQRLKADEAAVLQVLLSHFDTRQPYSCTAVHALRDWTRAKALGGELGAARLLATRQPHARPAQTQGSQRHP